MQQIELTRGRIALVDDEDYLLLKSLGSWCYSEGYAARRGKNFDGREGLIRMHQVVLNTPDGVQIDHKNCDGLDNRKDNLRLCSQSENTKNTSLSKRNVSGRKGVAWSVQNKKWRVRIHTAGKHKHIGYYTDLEEASNAYDAAALEHYGAFARTNKMIKESL